MDGQTDGQNYDSQDRDSIAASRGKKNNPNILPSLEQALFSVNNIFMGKTLFRI